MFISKALSSIHNLYSLSHTLYMSLSNAISFSKNVTKVASRVIKFTNPPVSPASGTNYDERWCLNCNNRGYIMIMIVSHKFRKFHLASSTSYIVGVMFKFAFHETYGVWIDCWIEREREIITGKNASYLWRVFFLNVSVWWWNCIDLIISWPDDILKQNFSKLSYHVILSCLMGATKTINDIFNLR